MLPLSTRIDFSDDEAMLREAAVTFCREQSSTRQVRERMAGETGFDMRLWKEMVSLGWSGIAVPERFGGSDLSLAAVATIAEPMGRHLMATPFAGVQGAIQALLACGDEALQARWLPALADGGIAALALMEEEGDWNLAAPSARGERRGAGVVLGGAKTLVLDAGVADVLVVSFLLEGAPALAFVDKGRVGTDRLRRESLIDETLRGFALRLDGIEVAGDAFVTGAAALHALEALRRCGVLLAAAEAAGGIAGVLDVTVDYLNTRTTFGRKIGSYQSLKHTCADILIGLERARSHVCHAGSLLAAGEDADIALRMAKVEAGDSFVFAADRAVQFHGGFGFTWDCDAQLFLRRALWLQSAWGDAAHHRRRLADALLGPA